MDQDIRRWSVVVCIPTLEEWERETDDALIQIHGAWDEEEIIYMQENNLRYTVRNGEKCPMYEGFVQEGWYWITDLNKIRLITKNRFIELLNRVSGD